MAAPFRALGRAFGPVVRAFRRRGKAGRAVLLALLALVVGTWWWTGSWEPALAALAFAVLVAPVLLVLLDRPNP